MLHEMTLGTFAGAVGTVTLNAATYADMAARARPPSSVPAEVAGKLAEKAGMALGADETEQNRKSGPGALSGCGVGAAYGLVRPLLGNVSKTRAGVVLGLAAMAGSDVPATALGVTDSTTWGVDSWISDIVPHLAYGLMTAVAYDALNGL